METNNEKNSKLLTKEDSVTIDFRLQDDGKLDVWISHEGSSGCHYTDMTPEKAGEYAAELIKDVLEI